MISWANRLKSYYSFLLRAVVLLLGVSLLSFSEVLERFDLVIYDKISTIQRYIPGSDVVIVAIDEESLQVLGRWPWSRSIHAELINQLTRIGSKVVAFDVLLAEPDERDPGADEMLGAAIANHGAVILPVIPAIDTNLQVPYIIKPLPFFGDSATLAHADVELDRDGVARRVFLHAGINTPKWPTIGLALVKKVKNIDGRDQPAQLIAAPVSTFGSWARADEAMIPYIGPPGSFQQISYAQIFYDESVLASLKGKIIFVGMTAGGMGTRFATPVSAVNHQSMSGIEWHANVFEMLRHDRAVYPASNFLASLISVIWVLVMLIIVGLLKKPFPVPILLVMLAGGIFCIGFSLRLLHVWIPPSAALIGTVAVYPLWHWRQFNQYMRSLIVARMHSNTALESIGDGVITTDAQDHIIHMNSGAEKILGVNFNIMQGKSLQQALDLSSSTQDAKLELSIPVYGTSTIQCYLKAASGDKRMVSITRHLLHDDQAELMGFVIVIVDITDTIELTQQVARLASYDALTELPNRSLLLARFEEMVVVAKETGKVIIVFFITLDHFKKINDAMGHRAGDALLHDVAQRLQRVVGKDDILARWSGDEFVVLFNYLHNEQNATQMAQKILDVIRQQFDIDRQAVFVTASIGICFYPRDGEQSEMVLERAGTAMYSIKDEGGNNFGFYSPASSVIWTRDRLDFEKELRLALENGHLQVFYQPILDARQHRMVRMEALVRWQHPVRGLLSPGDFIPLAEQAGLIERLGETVLLSACIAAYDLLRSDKPVNVSVNVNPRQLLYGNFEQTVSQVLRCTGLPAKSLMLEITENAVVNDIARASDVLNKIKELGVSIALDDFGTGYSSLSLLRELPIDILKIDKSFIRALDQNVHDLMITQAIIGLGKNLSLAVIAEGVETQQQMRVLLDHHCYLQQGFYYSRPVPFESLVKLMRDKRYPDNFNKLIA